MMKNKYKFIAALAALSFSTGAMASLPDSASVSGNTDEDVIILKTNSADTVEVTTPALPKPGISLDNPKNNNFLKVNLGAGLQSYSVDVELDESKPLPGGNFSLEYIYFVSNRIGVSAGVGFSRYRGVSILNGDDATWEYDDNRDEEFQQITVYSDLKEYESVFAFEIPVGAYYNLIVNDAWTFLGGAGLKVILPFKSKYEVKDGVFTTEGYYPSQNVRFSNLPQHGFDKNEMSYNGKMENKVVLGIYLDATMQYYVRKHGFYLFGGLYGSIGLTNTAKNTDQKLYNVETQAYSGVFSCDLVNRVSFSQIGLRIGMTLPLNLK